MESLEQFENLSLWKKLCTTPSTKSWLLILTISPPISALMWRCECSHLSFRRILQRLVPLHVLLDILLQSSPPENLKMKLHLLSQPFLSKQAEDFLKNTHTHTNCTFKDFEQAQELLCCRKSEFECEKCLFPDPVAAMLS